ncbi:MAG: hypothetical protein R2877_04525 [Bdellovibrionota bacterium]
MMLLETYRERVKTVDYGKAIEAARKHLHPKDVKVIMVCTANLFLKTSSKSA